VTVEIVPAVDVDAAALRAFIVAAWHADSVVAHGERLHPAGMPGFVATRHGTIVGHASYRIDGDACELTAIAVEPRSRGIGSQLLDAVVAEARAAGCASVWLTTTNDNLDALRFYQRRGFRLVRIRPGAVDGARRTLKPEIPEVGSYGIRMRDELDLELQIGEGGG
jgi:ribosomal protein S18 acetylase RimI-like enzyme